MTRPSTSALALSLLLAFGCDETPSAPDASGVDAGTATDAGGMDAVVTRTDGGGSSELCAALEAYVTRCGASASPCAPELVAGCAPLAAALGPAFVASVEACLPTSNPTNCFFDAIMAATPSGAHASFRDAFCDGCLADEPTCDAQFFESAQAARAIILATSDATAAELTSRCASGVLCAERVDDCATETITLLGVPEASAECFVETLLAPTALPAGCGVATDAGVDAGGLADAGTDAGSEDPDAGGGTPLACTAREPNDDRASAAFLGSIDDRSAFPAGNVSAGIESGGDEDWFSFHDEDTSTGFLYPQVDLVIADGGDLDLCLYYECDSVGDSTISCETGTPSSLGGLDGCCSLGTSSSESVTLDPNCTGLDESGTIHVRVFAGGSIAACEPYFLAWGDG